MRCCSVRLVALLIASLLNPGGAFGTQEPPKVTPAESKFKLTVIEDATQYKRLTKGRASSQTVVKVTDENDVPVAGIAVLFAIPQGSGGGAAFAGGVPTSVVTTSPAGVATSGPFTAAANGSFNMSVTASVPGGTIKISVPINMAAAAGAAGAAAGAGAGSGGGMSGATIGILVAVGAAVAAGLAVGLTQGGSSATTPPPTGPTDTRTGIRVGIGGPVTVGPRP